MKIENKKYRKKGKEKVEIEKPVQEPHKRFPNPEKARRKPPRIFPKP